MNELEIFELNNKKQLLNNIRSLFEDDEFLGITINIIWEWNEVPRINYREGANLGERFNNNYELNLNDNQLLKIDLSFYERFFTRARRFIKYNEPYLEIYDDELFDFFPNHREDFIKKFSTLFPEKVL